MKGGAGAFDFLEDVGSLGGQMNGLGFSLETMRLRCDFFVSGCVVMPEHVHLLVSEPRKALLSKAIQALKL